MDEIRATLRKLPEETQKKVMAVALRRATGPLIAAAKANVPRRTGALRDSIAAVVKKGSRGGSYVVVGPARGYFSGGKRLGKGESAKGADAPANYGHLVEFGHHAVSPGKGTSRRKKTANTIRFIAARPFLRPALASSQSAVGDQLAAGIAAGIAQALKRIVKNPGSRG